VSGRAFRGGQAIAIGIAIVVAIIATVWRCG
jgi:hypothetical protein